MLEIKNLTKVYSDGTEAVKNVSFTSFQVPGMGFEPAIIAAAVTSEKGKVTENSLTIH